MRQDTDVARVAAALRAPAIRYRSFGNEPVRTPVSAPEADPYALLGAAMNAAAEIGQQQGMPPAEAWQPPAPPPAPLSAIAPAANAQPYWPETPSPQAVPTQSWAEPPQPWSAPPQAPTEPQTWPEPAIEAWPALHSAPQHQAQPPTQHWIEPERPAPPAVQPEPEQEQTKAQPWSEPPPILRQPEPAAPPPARAEAAGWTPAPVAAPAAPAAAPVVAAPAAPAAAPVVAAPAAPAAPAVPPALTAPAVFGLSDMTLLQAADLPMTPAFRPALSTLAELSSGPAPALAQAAAPRALFPLIDALDMPGSLLARRSLLVENRDALPEEVVSPAPEPPPARATVLMSAEIDLPLSELLRLLAADPAESADAFQALRRPQSANQIDA